MEILEVKNLTRSFQVGHGLWGKKTIINAVDDISFSVKRNEVFALVGESGSGKSTVARLILRLLPPTSGHIYFNSTDINQLKGQDLMSYRRNMQVVFQDPFASLNPRMRIIDTLSEPLIVHKIGNKEERLKIIKEILQKVGLSDDVLNRYPHEFSGGQRQRICIARALVLSPQFIIADEPLSSLDVSIQAQIINLFVELKKELNISLLFISHDLSVIHYISDRVAVMYMGKIVEMGNTEEVYDEPLHPYTRLLISSAPKIHREAPISSRQIKESFDGISTDGCAFEPRCQFSKGTCKTAKPQHTTIKGRQVACHLYT
ncbi:MAG: ABC transporter ATP-binding protein [Thermodesulfovibrionales bacterium]|nr:ABC transporter ATP-binding protein [Thermodesulfovibrionales bacterium]